MLLTRMLNQCASFHLREESAWQHYEKNHCFSRKLLNICKRCSFIFFVLCTHISIMLISNWSLARTLLLDLQQYILYRSIITRCHQLPVLRHMAKIKYVKYVFAQSIPWQSEQWYQNYCNTLTISLLNTNKKSFCKLGFMIHAFTKLTRNLFSSICIPPSLP